MFLIKAAKQQVLINLKFLPYPPLTSRTNIERAILETHDSQISTSVQQLSESKNAEEKSNEVLSQSGSWAMNSTHNAKAIKMNTNVPSKVSSRKWIVVYYYKKEENKKHQPRA